MCCRVRIRGGKTFHVSTAAPAAVQADEFGGFIRMESKDMWRGKILDWRMLPIEAFAENIFDENHKKTGKVQWFEVPKNKAIQICKVQGIAGLTEARVITVGANEEVKEKTKHNRMPRLVNVA